MLEFIDIFFSNYKKKKNKNTKLSKVVFNFKCYNTRNAITEVVEEE